ncbi:hypothetical protein LTR36_001672 [Oleoguttula mirabilis]|uniref:Uncharacterized protein n=1 Tax=Oleoguttula mirabilis TaxID=1507867 RepID=A0AAV9JNS0_9PEZI|nr:hypothetical protein LTR36_001672 [Oleoguttula mirabilis]
MASSSPSEFLTFYRRLATSQSLRYRPVSRAAATRPFSISSARRAGTGDGNIISDKGTQQDTSSGDSTGGSREHALDKGKEDPNVQSYESGNARQYVTTPFLGLRTGAEGFEGDGTGEPEVWERTYADSLAWRRSKAEGTGGQAVQQSDERNSTAKAKKDHPEAPDVVIGMQDERGGKGA